MYDQRMNSTDEGSSADGDARSSVYAVEVMDPRGELVDRAGVDEADLRQIDELMRALGALRDTEQRLSEASLEYMKLNQTDMRALQFLIACGHRGAIATPGAIAGHLSISSASTTKLLDRLERGGHVTRSQHPSDRRALAIAITAETRDAAIETVGRHHARRFHAAARLRPAEREVVTRFLRDMAAEIDVGDADWANRS